MSFILDALRRADRERESERGGVPSLYTQAAPLPTPQAASADGPAPRPWLWLAAGLGGGLVLAAVWALWSATPSATVVPVVAPSPAPAPAVAAVPAVTTAPPEPPAPPKVAEPRPAPPIEQAPPRTPPRAEPKPAPARAAAPPIRQIDELSAEQRAALPKLTLGGAMYSANASSRRLIVNGQLLSEGEAVAPGVTIEEIRLKSVVLRTKDLRYELGF